MVALVRLALIAALISLLAALGVASTSAGSPTPMRSFVDCPITSDPPGPFNVRADDVSCDRARKIAKEWVRKSQQIEAAPGHVRAWDCSRTQSGYETSAWVCRRSGKRIKFTTGVGP